MSCGRVRRTAAPVVLALLVSASAGWSSPALREYAGSVVDLNRATGIIVVADVGPLLANGTSEVAERRVRVTPTTQFARVERTRGAAPSGWVGDYVETALPQWHVRPGDFVAVTVAPGAPGGSGDVDAVTITVVDAGPERPAALPAVPAFPLRVRP
jgi:hypothetical protein